MQTQATASGRILVVEDNPITRKLVGFTLERNGYVVLEAPDARTAVELMDEGAPDLVLQDLLLPDLDGFELVHRLRKCTRGVTVPILAFSGFLSGHDEARVSAAGFDDLIAKPVEPTRLLQTVAAYLPKSALTSEVFGRKRKLVVADDDAVQLKLTCYHLSLAGFRVQPAPDGVEALAAARRVRPSVIVLDVMMPRLDGFAACMQARQSPELRDIPVILVTSTYVEAADHELARRAGANDFVVRTPDSRALMDALRACLDGPQKTAAAATDDTRVEEVERERVDRTMRQLERQVTSNARMTQRCAALTAELSVLGAASDALSRHHDIETTLESVLASCFDVAGVSIGALYLARADGSFRVRTFGGHAGWDTSPLETFFDQPDLLSSIIASETATRIPSDEVPADVSAAILNAGGIASALVAPLVHHEQRLGAFMMLSKSSRLADADLMSFAQGVASQIAQAIALSQAFDKLARLEARQRALLDNASSGIFTLDLDGRLLDVNRMGETLFGSSKQELLGRSFVELVAERDREYAEVQLRKAGAGNRAGVEIRVARADGNLLTLELTCSLVEASGERLILVLAVDVTERNRLRRQAVLNDKLATMGVLAAGIAHEINNPMTYLLGNLELAETALSELPRELRRTSSGDLGLLLREAIQGGARVRDIVRGLKGFTRVDDDDVALFDLNDVLDAALSMAAHELKSRARVEKRYAPEIPAIIGSQGKLEQVFVNLLVNAAHAITEGNPTRNAIEIVSALDGAFVRVDVRDTGKGIPDEVVQHIFEPFFTTKPTGVGTGLGLAISHEIVRNHGGEIRVDSVVGRGTTFSVLLPLDAGIRRADAKLPSGASAARTRARVLLVDDDEHVLRVLTRMIEGTHDVTPVLSARAALERIGSEPFDVIVCDFRMPEMNGLDLFRHLSERRPDCADRFVLVSGNMPGPGASTSFPFSSDRFLRKPCTAAELLAIIGQTLQRNRS